MIGREQIIEKIKTVPEHLLEDVYQMIIKISKPRYQKDQWIEFLDNIDDFAVDTGIDDFSINQGTGNYLKIREKLFGNETVDTLCQKIADFEKTHHFPDGH